MTISSKHKFMFDISYGLQTFLHRKVIFWKVYYQKTRQSTKKNACCRRIPQSKLQKVKMQPCHVDTTKLIFCSHSSDTFYATLTQYYKRGYNNFPKKLWCFMGGGGGGGLLQNNVVSSTC